MKPKVLIINPPFIQPLFPSLGCAYLKSALKNAGFQVDIIDLNISFFKEIEAKDKVFWDSAQLSKFYDPLHQKEFDNLLKKYEYFINQKINKIIKEDYKYVLFSISYCQKYVALKLAKKIKEVDKNIQIIFGGAECFKYFCASDNYKNLMRKNNFIDYHVYSPEGEKIIIELIDEIENNKEVQTNGVIKRRGNQIIENSEPKLIKNINTISFPDWEGFNLDLYLMKNTLPIMSSRGCMNKCVFCSEHKIFEHLRVRTAENIFAEIKQNYKKFGATHINFNDSSMNNNLKKLEKLCDLLINSDVNIHFYSQVNFNNHLNKNLLKKMYQAGCRLLTFGLESGSQKIVDSMNKNFDIKKSEEVIKNAKESGIKTRINFMLGFPGETKEDFQETLDYLKRNKDYIDEVGPSDLFMVILKNTDLADNLEKFNIKSNVGSEHILQTYVGKYFWETRDGKNNILVRLHRFERFCKLAKKLKIDNFYKSTKHKNREYIIYNDYKKIGFEIKNIPTSIKFLRLMKGFNPFN